MTNQSTFTTALLSVSVLLGGLAPTVVHADWSLGLNAYKDNESYRDKKYKYGLAILNPKYRGDKFNLDNGTASYDFTNSSDSAIEAIVSNHHSGFRSKDGKTFKGMKKRKPSLDVGARGILNTGVVGPAVVEVTRDFYASKGYEVNAKLGGITPHAPHWTGKREVKVAAMGGVRYQSAKTVDYYYGVKSAESTANRNRYSAKSALTPYIGVEGQVNLSQHVSFDGGLTVSKRADSIRKSPLTNNKKYDVGVNIGFSYWF